MSLLRRMARALIEAQVDVNEHDEVVRVLIEAGHSTEEIKNLEWAAVEIARFVRPDSVNRFVDIAETGLVHA